MNEAEKQRIVEEIRTHLTIIEANQQDTLRRAILVGGLLQRLAKEYPTKAAMYAAVGIKSSAACSYVRLTKKEKLIPSDITTLSAAISSLRGKPGNPKAASPMQQAQIAELRAAGQSIRKIADVMGLTRSVIHNVVLGDYNKPKPTKPQRKLADGDADTIRSELNAGAKNKDVAARWRISTALVSQIKNNLAHRGTGALLGEWATVKSKLMDIWNDDPAEYEKIVEQIDMRHQMMLARQLKKVS